MRRETEPATVAPDGELSFSVVGADAGFRGRLENALISRGVPALLMEDAKRGHFRGIVVRVLADEGGQPLTWVTSEPGRHSWVPVDGIPLLEDIAAELGCIVAHPDGLVGGSDAPHDVESDNGHDAEILALEKAFSVDTLTWYAPGEGVVDVLGVFARRAGQSLIGCPAGGGYIAAPTGDPDTVFESMVWTVSGGLVLARSGNRRGAGFSSKRDPVVIHWWDEEWIAVDPSQPWDMGGDGRRVRDWLDELVPEVETEPWTSAFHRDGVSGDEIRVVLRSHWSDDSTFDRLVRAAGLPPLLADIADGRVEFATVEGAGTFEPNSLWGVLKKGIRDEMRRPVEYPKWARPLATWEQQRNRRSPLYLALNGVALGVFVLSVTAFGDDNGLLWLKWVALAAIVCDVLWPRKRASEDSSGVESP